MTSVLKVSGVHKRFGENQALNGAELWLKKGEWLALLGPNGAGKTTLVRSIAGQVSLDKGGITLLDVILDGTAESERARRKLGIVPQDIALYPELTAPENIRAFGGLHGLSRGELEDRLDWALSWTGLGDRAKEPVKRFSGGMKRRLNIACGVLHAPEVVLLDEPTVGVDPQSRQRIWEMLGELRANGASLLLTTHQLDEAQQVSDRIVIIDHGKVIAAGTFADLLKQTIGAKRRITCQLEQPAPEALRQTGFDVVDDRTLMKEVDDIAGELPTVLDTIDSAGGKMLDLHIEAPTLQAVFIHLTGRELRE